LGSACVKAACKKLMKLTPGEALDKVNIWKKWPNQVENAVKMNKWFFSKVENQVKRRKRPNKALRSSVMVPV